LVVYIIYINDARSSKHKKFMSLNARILKVMVFKKYLPLVASYL